MYEQITPESILDSVLSGISQFSTAEGSFARTLLAPMAYEIWKTYTALEGVPDMIFVTAQSGVYIDRRAADFGITRKAGARAAASISLTGTAFAGIPKGKIFLTAGGLRYTLDEAVTLDGSGAGSGTLTAEAEGAAYNVSAGEISVQQTAQTGLTGFSVSAAIGGIDPETDEALAERLQSHLQRPATSGNVYQYQQWAESVPGVGRARVLPLWDGPGTVKVLLAGSDYGVAGSDVVEAVSAYIGQVRPIGASVTVESAAALSLSVSAVVAMDATTTADRVKTAFSAALNGYLREISFKKDMVVYNRVLFLLLDVEGVSDVISLSINGGTGNIAIGQNQVPVMTGVSIHES